MATADSIYKQVRAICLSFPDTKETMTWGKPHFRVGEKIFAGFEEENGKPTIGFKLEKPPARELSARGARCRPAPYVGAHGWVEMEVSGAVDWDQVRGYVLESWRLIAPPKSQAKLALGAPPSKAPRAPKRKAKAPAKPRRGKGGKSR